uniref:RNase H type-1 domain-containing protein n=1 Tax=Manihot esculenta TaxID=3983 RepID=A0A2C9UQE4_MANES
MSAIFAIRRGYMPAFLESGSLQLVQAINFPSSPSWELDAIYLDLRLLLHSHPNISVVHIARTANCSADWLARQARVNLLRQDWISNPPPIFLSLLCNDSFPDHDQ